jgi:hypothetical protein
MSDLDEILDDLFHGAAFAAFVDEIRLTGKPPTLEATKARAYLYYEEALAEKNRSKS